MPFLPGTKTLKISSLELPGDFTRRQKTDNVKRLQQSIEKVGVINLPVVDRSHRLIAGHDRVQALYQRGEDEVTVRVFDGTETELALVQWAENHHRRATNPDDLTWSKLLELPPDEPDEPEQPRKRGRPVTPRGKARRRVAEAVGADPEAIARKDRAVQAKESAPELPANFPTFGFIPEAEVVADILDAFAHFGAARLARTKMEHEHRELAKQAKAPPPVFLDHETLDSLVPVQLCRWCEASPHRSNCDVCQGRGWLAAVDDLTPPPKKEAPDADIPF